MGFDAHKQNPCAIATAILTDRLGGKATGRFGSFLLKNFFCTVSDGVFGAIKPLIGQCSSIVERSMWPMFLKR